MTTKDRSHREMALLSTYDLSLGRQRHHHVHGRRRHDDRHLQLHMRVSTINQLYQSFTAHQHPKGHTVPKQVSPLDDDYDITESTRKKNVMVLQSENSTV